MNKVIYHGGGIVKAPNFNFGSSDNDYGKGFYCTDNYDEAVSWASGRREGYVNSYEFDPSDLNIKTLDKEDVLEWLAILLNFRTIKSAYITIDESTFNYRKQYLINNFYTNIRNVDVVVGYRIDASYSFIASAFIEGKIGLNNLYTFMLEGNLGYQTVLISKLSYSRVKHISSKPVEYSSNTNSISRAGICLTKMKEAVNKTDFIPNGATILDIMEGRYE